MEPFELQKKQTSYVRAAFRTFSLRIRFVSGSCSLHREPFFSRTISSIGQGSCCRNFGGTFMLWDHGVVPSGREETFLCPITSCPIILGFSSGVRLGHVLGFAQTSAAINMGAQWLDDHPHSISISGRAQLISVLSQNITVTT